MKTNRYARHVRLPWRLLGQIQDRDDQSRALIENMPSGFILLEVLRDETGHPVDHRLLQANASFERVTGLKRAAEIGRTSANLSFQWPPDVAQRYYAVALGGEPLHWERFNESIQGYYDVRVYSPRHGQFAMVFDDIADRKRSEAALSLAYFQGEQALDLTKAGYWHVSLTDPEWFDSTERTAQLLGDPPREGWRYRILDDWFVHAQEGDLEASARTLEAYQEAAEGRSPEFNSVFAYRRPIDGRVIWVHTLGRVMKDAQGHPSHVYGVIRDITGQRQAEEELARHRNHLEELVATRTSELRIALDAAEAASRAKSAFLASMSHELRTPLNAVLGFSQLMAREPGRDPKDLARLEKILRAGEHLLQLINDVLSISRIEAHKQSLSLAAFDPRVCLENIEAMVRVKAEAKGLRFDLEVDTRLPGTLEGDEDKLRQVLLNLLGNAVKFTQAGRIGLKAGVLDMERIRFEVSDTGPGISKEEQSQLFGSFVQTEAGRRSAEGSGLGLNLSQALVHLMGGQIVVESQVGRGSTFHFDLPLLAAGGLLKRGADRRRQVRPDGPPVPKQLLVEDLVPKNIQELDAAWRQTFFDCLIGGEIQKARSLTHELGPAQESLAAYLRKALDEFRLDELERLFAPRETS